MRISKKILACVLAALMVIAMMPISALAEGSGAPGIGGPGMGTDPIIPSMGATTYEVSDGASLRSTVANASAGDTIKFTADITFEAESQVGIIVNNNLIIDLNGHTIVSGANGTNAVNDPDHDDNADTPNNVFVVRNGATVEFKDSQGGGSWTFSYSGNTQANFVEIRDNSTARFVSGTYTANSTTSPAVIADIEGANSVAYVSGGTFNINYNSSGKRAYGFSLPTNSAELRIDGGTFNSDSSYNSIVNQVNQYSVINIYGGSFNGGLGLHSNSKTAVIYGGTFKKEDGTTVNTNSKIIDHLADAYVLNEETGMVQAGDATSEAKIGNVLYSTLEEAIAAVANNQKIKLINDVNVASTIELTDGKKFTINLNNHEIYSSVRVFNVRHGKLTIDGTGVISTTAANAAIGVYGSTSSSDSSYSVLNFKTYATIDAPNGYGVMVGANNGAAFGVDVSIYGTINSKWGLFINGNVAETDSKNAAKFTLGTSTTPARVSSSNADSVIYAAGYAKWTITNAELTGGSAIYIKSGNMTINKGTYTANGEKTDYVFENNGCEITGDCVIIDSCGYPGSVPTVTINGGTFTSANGAAVASYCKQDDPSYPDATFPRVGNVIPSNSTAVFSTDSSDVAADGYKTVYDESKGGYVVAEDLEAVNGSNINVADEITQNFYLDKTTYGTDAYVSVYYNHASNVEETPDFDTDIKALSALTPATNAGEYTGAPMVSITQAPAQTTEIIRINVYATEADANAGTNAIDTIEYSVYDYCTNLIENYTGAKETEVKNLAKATLDYAAAAQTYFNYNTEDMATKDNGGYYGEVASVNFDGVAGITSKPTGIAGVTVVVKSDLEINFQTKTPISVTGASIDTTDGASRFGASVLEEMNGDYYVINIKGIEPANMDNTIIINTSRGQFEFTANSIMKLMAKSKDAKMVTLAKAMYLYGQAANTYFAS